MQRILSHISREGFEGGSGSLDFSCDCIELTLAPGAVYEGSFQVYGNGEDGTFGYVFSTDPRMECLTADISSSQDTVNYRFVAQNMEAGKNVEGEFTVVSNHGEYTLPFSVHIELTQIQSSLGEIRNLTQFANLARENWAEAVKLFYSPAFLGLLRGNDRKYYDLYRGLCSSYGNQQNVEEFLVTCGKKEPIRYYADREVLKAAGEASDVTELSLVLRKDGWGYTGLGIFVEGDFVFTQKTMITDDDFLGNQCTLPVYVDNSLLRRGRNFGLVRLADAKVTLEVPVEICTGKLQEAAVSVRLERDKLIVELLDLYQQHRLGQIGASVWLNQTGRIVERLVSMNEKDVEARLFQAQLLIAQGRAHEAGWLLTHSMELMERNGEDNADLMAYYLYLTTRMNQDKEYFRRAAGQIEELYRKNKTSWRIAWLMLAISSRYRSYPAEKWELLEKQFRYGCTSPIWYMEALITLNENPALLRRLDEYEVQVLFYGARKGMLSADLMEQFLYLISRKREFSAVLLRLLIRCYEQRSDDRVLQEICAQLIKGSRMDEEAFGWYEKGVDKELRLTRLYEYYVLSMNLEKEHKISRKALMYFAWQSNLDYEHTAYLYGYVLRNKAALGEIWEQYRTRIEHFVVDQILKNHINKHLAFLYQEMVTQAMFSNQLAMALARLLFAYKITVEAPVIARVLVMSPDMDCIREYPVINGCAYASLYGEKDTVLLEDKDRNRYACGIAYNKEKMMDPLPFLELMALYVSPGKVDIEFDRCLWEYGRKQKNLSQDTLERGKYLLERDEVSPFIKRKIQMKLLTYYRSSGDLSGLDTCLGKIQWEALDEVSRAEVIQSMVIRGKMEAAYEAVQRLGVLGVEPETLLKLCDWKISRDGLARETILTDMTVAAFEQNQYSSDTLQYLAENLVGKTQKLEAVRKAASGYHVDLSNLSGRLLVQMLFTGKKSESFSEILRFFLSSDKNLEVKKAVIAGCAYSYLIKGEEQEAKVFCEIGSLYIQGEEINNVEKLAYLKYKSRENGGAGHASDAEWSSKDVEVIRGLLEEMLRQGICLNFFKQLPECDDLLEGLSDKTIVECQGRPGTRVTIHYAICKADGEMGAYRKEEMHMAPGGIFYKEFVLFFGEILQYYFTKESDRQTQISQLMTIQYSESNESKQGRFHAINEMLKCGSLDAFESLDKQLEEFQHRDYLGNSLFTLR